MCGSGRNGPHSSPLVARYDATRVPGVQAAPQRHYGLIPPSISESNSVLRPTIWCCCTEKIAGERAKTDPFQQGAMAMPHRPPNAMQGITRERRRRCGAARPLGPVRFDVQTHYVGRQKYLFCITTVRRRSAGGDPGGPESRSVQLSLGPGRRTTFSLTARIGHPMGESKTPGAARPLLFSPVRGETHGPVWFATSRNRFSPS